MAEARLKASIASTAACGIGATAACAGRCGRGKRGRPRDGALHRPGLSRGRSRIQIRPESLARPPDNAGPGTVDLHTFRARFPSSMSAQNCFDCARVSSSPTGSLARKRKSWNEFLLRTRWTMTDWWSFETSK